MRSRHLYCSALLACAAGLLSAFDVRVHSERTIEIENETGRRCVTVRHIETGHHLTACRLYNQAPHEWVVHSSHEGHWTLSCSRSPVTALRARRHDVVEPEYEPRTPLICGELSVISGGQRFDYSDGAEPVARLFLPDESPDGMP